MKKQKQITNAKKILIYNSRDLEITVLRKKTYFEFFLRKNIFWVKEEYFRSSLQ